MLKFAPTANSNVVYANARCRFVEDSSLQQINFGPEQKLSHQTNQNKFNMNSNNLISEVFTDIEKGKFERANAFLADDFRAVLLGKEVNRPIYLSAYRSLLQGIPDLKLHVQNVRSQNGKVLTRLKVSGTNSRPIPALMRGWHEIPATNKRVEELTMDLEITMNQDKIREIRNAPDTSGLFFSLLENLGADYTKFRTN
jgi:predicted ester cyclase